MERNFFIHRADPLDAGSALEFFPPKGSDELHEALKQAYPHLKNLQSRMRQAVIEFHLAEQEQDVVFEQLSTPIVSDSTSPEYLPSPLSSFASTPMTYSHSIQSRASPRTESSAQMPTQEQLMTVWTLPSKPEAKIHKRRCMSEAEKIAYKQKRLEGACAECKRKRRKCIHGTVSNSSSSSTASSSRRRTKQGKQASHSTAAPVSAQGHGTFSSIEFSPNQFDFDFPLAENSFSFDSTFDFDSPPGPFPYSEDFINGGDFELFPELPLHAFHDHLQQGFYSANQQSVSQGGKLDSLEHRSPQQDGYSPHESYLPLSSQLYDIDSLASPTEKRRRPVSSNHQSPHSSSGSDSSDYPLQDSGYHSLHDLHNSSPPNPQGLGVRDLSQSQDVPGLLDVQDEIGRNADRNHVPKSSRSLKRIGGIKSLALVQAAGPQSRQFQSSRSSSVSTSSSGVLEDSTHQENSTGLRQSGRKTSGICQRSRQTLEEPQYRRRQSVSTIHTSRDKEPALSRVWNQSMLVESGLSSDGLRSNGSLRSSSRESQTSSSPRFSEATRATSRITSALCLKYPSDAVSDDRNTKSPTARTARLNAMAFIGTLFWFLFAGTAKLLLQPCESFAAKVQMAASVAVESAYASTAVFKNRGWKTSGSNFPSGPLGASFLAVALLSVGSLLRTGVLDVTEGFGGLGISAVNLTPVVNDVPVW